MKIQAKIDRLVDNENSKLRAIASANIGDAFAVHGLKVYDGQKGLFVQMPQNSYESGGKKHYSDQFHPITADARNQLNDAVLDAYDKKLAEVQSNDQEEAPGFSQSM